VDTLFPLEQHSTDFFATCCNSAGTDIEKKDFRATH